MYNKMNKPLPEGWALDKDGHASTNAPDVLSNIVSKKGGGIMPLGGNKEVTGSHKGYGYGMICELFSSIPVSYTHLDVYKRQPYVAADALADS